jgi:type IV secretion system protein TrbL
MIPGLPGISDLLGGAIDSATGSVFDGIVTWMARGLAVLIEWIWTTLDNATTPRITEPWFVTGLVKPIGLLALAVTIALMLASAIQAALAGRPEQIFDAFKQGAWTLVATGLTITVMDLLLGVVDQASAGIWDQARPDLQHLLEGVISVMSTSAMSGMGFLAVLMMLLMYFALIGLAVALAMRNALIYVTAVMAPVVFASSVLPLFRESSRKIIHLGVALIISKLAIVVTLTLAVKMMANATNIAATGDQVQDGVGALGLLFAGVTCFAVASITPMVLYKLMPTVEGAVIGAGIAGGWGRGAMTGMYAASTAKNLGGSVAKLAGGPVPGGGDLGGGGGGRSQSASPATMPTSCASGGSSAGTGASASGAAGAGGGAAGAGAAAGAVAAPVMVATAGINAVKSGISKVTETAGATADAAGSSATSGSSSPTGEAPTTQEGSTSSAEGPPSTKHVPNVPTEES